MSTLGTRTVLKRFFERLFPYVPRYPAVAVGIEGDVPLESAGRGAPDQDWPIGSKWTQIDPAAAGDILWVKRAAGVAGWAKLGTILNEAQDTAIATAQAAADAAQDTADGAVSVNATQDTAIAAAAAAAAAAQTTANGAVTVNTTQAGQITALQSADTTIAAAAAAAQAAADGAQGDVDALSTAYNAQAALLGDLNEIVGPSAPPGSPDTVVEGFQFIIAQLNEMDVNFQSMPSDVAATDATNGSDTGLGMVVEAGVTYAFEWWMFVTTSAPTIGARWSARSVDAAGTMALMSSSVIASGNMSSYHVDLNNWTSEPNGPGSVKILVRISALFKCTTPGTVHLYIKPEGGTATAHAGSVFMYRTVASA